jgi:hypothetical protein
VVVVGSAEEAVDFAEAAARLWELEVLRLGADQCICTDHSPRLPRPFERYE